MPSAIEDLLGDEVTVDRDYIGRRVDDWKRRVSALFDDVVSWFPELTSDRSDTVEMDEELMRKYGVQPARFAVLRLCDGGGQIARFVPIGLWIIGANGRLDLFARKGQFVIVDRSDESARPRWEIAPALRRLDTEPLSRSTLLPVLR